MAFILARPEGVVAMAFLAADMFALASELYL
jgi:hypothetical protein